MIWRCINPEAHNFRNYGGRGISVCERWRDVDTFLSDMGQRPGPEYSLDRINNDGNYEPENCRWATRSQQNSNQRPGIRKRANRRPTFKGESRCTPISQS